MGLRDYILTSSQTRKAKRELEKIGKTDLNGFLKKKFAKQSPTSIGSVSTVLRFVGSQNKTRIKAFTDNILGDINGTQSHPGESYAVSFINAIKLQANSRHTNKSGLFCRLIYTPLKNLTNEQSIQDFFNNESNIKTLARNVVKFLIAKKDADITIDTLSTDKDRKYTAQGGRTKWEHELMKDDIDEDIKGDKKTPPTRRQSHASVIKKLKSNRYSDILKVFMALVLWRILKSMQAKIKEKPATQEPPSEQPNQHQGQGTEKLAKEQERPKEEQPDSPPIEEKSNPSTPPPQPAPSTTPTQTEHTASEPASNFQTDAQQDQAAQAVLDEAQTVAEINKLMPNATQKGIDLWKSNFMFFEGIDFKFDANHEPRIIKSSEDNLYCIYPALVNETELMVIAKALDHIDKMFGGKIQAEKKLYGEFSQDKKKMLESIINFPRKNPIPTWGDYLSRRWNARSATDTRTNQGIIDYYRQTLGKPKGIDLQNSKFIFYEGFNLEVETENGRETEHFGFDDTHKPRIMRASKSDNLYCIYPALSGAKYFVVIGKALDYIDRVFSGGIQAEKKSYGDLSADENKKLSGIIQYKPTEPAQVWDKYLRLRCNANVDGDFKTNQDILDEYRRPQASIISKRTADGVLLHGPGAIKGEMKKEDLHYGAKPKSDVPDSMPDQETYKISETIDGTPVNKYDFQKKLENNKMFEALAGYPSEETVELAAMIKQNTFEPTLEREVNIKNISAKKCTAKIGFSDYIIQTVPQNYKTTKVTRDDGSTTMRLSGQDIIPMFERLYPRPDDYELYQIIQAASQSNGLESVGNYHSDLTEQFKDPTQGPTVCSTSTMAWARRDMMYKDGTLPDSAAELIEALVNAKVIQEVGDGYVACEAYRHPSPKYYQYFYKCGYIQPWVLNTAGIAALAKAVADHPCGYMSQAASTDEPIQGRNNSEKKCSFKYAFGAAMSYQSLISAPTDDASRKLNKMWIKAQYSNIIKDAIRASDSLSENNIILVHLAGVGQGAFNNPRGITDEALEEVYDENKKYLLGSNIRVITHWNYSGSGSK